MIHYWGNVIEAVFWMMIAATVYLRSDHSSAPGRLGVGTRAAVAFFWFGISDLIEVQTGAQISGHSPVLSFPTFRPGRPF